MNFGRILVIASNVFREVIRDRVLYLIAFFATLMVAAVRLLPELSAGTQNKILLDLGLAAMEILGLVLVALIGTNLINKEIEKRTILVLTAKPISRVEFVVGKHLGLSAVLLVLITAMAAIYFLFLSLSQVEYPAATIVVAVIYMFLKLSLIAAVAILFGAFTSSLLAMLLTLAIYVMGNFSRDLVALGIMTQNPSIQQISNSLYLVLPDLSRLDMKNQAVYAVLPHPTTLLLNAGYGLLYMVLLLAIASLIFNRREF